MQYTEEVFEINLENTSDSKDVVDGVVSALDTPDRKSKNIKLKLGNIQINQSQMIFVKSLVESFGYELVCVESNNDLTNDALIEAGISKNCPMSSYDIQNIKLDEIREEFKAGFENAGIEEREEDEEHQKAVGVIKSDGEADVQKQVIGVYRKADEKENELEFQNEEVDFYATPTDEVVVADTKNTIYVNQTLRNGQVLEYDGNVVVIGDCHPGSEIKATGDITVWGVLGSIAHAGIKGNSDARIRALKMNAVQLRIANCYSRRPDGGNIPYIVKSSTFTPEEARIVDDNIVLFKMAQS